MARFAVGVPLILLLASIASTQTRLQSDPQALSFASPSIGLDFHKSLSAWPSWLIC